MHSLGVAPILRVVPSVLHLLQRLSHIKFRLRGEQYKGFKTWKRRGKANDL